MLWLINYQVQINVMKDHVLCEFSIAGTHSKGELRIPIPENVFEKPDWSPNAWIAFWEEKVAREIGAFVTNRLIERQKGKG